MTTPEQIVAELRKRFPEPWFCNWRLDYTYSSAALERQSLAYVDVAGVFDSSKSVIVSRASYNDLNELLAGLDRCAPPSPAPAAEGDDYQRGWNDAMKYRGKESFIATADSAPPSPAPAAEEAKPNWKMSKEDHEKLLATDTRGYAAEFQQIPPVSPAPPAGEGDAETFANWLEWFGPREDYMTQQRTIRECNKIAAFIRTQAAEITRLQAENDRLRDDLDLHKKIRASQGALINANRARLSSLEALAERMVNIIKKEQPQK